MEWTINKAEVSKDGKSMTLEMTADDDCPYFCMTLPAAAWHRMIEAKAAVSSFAWEYGRQQRAMETMLQLENEKN